MGSNVCRTTLSERSRLTLGETKHSSSQAYQEMGYPIIYFLLQTFLADSATVVVVLLTPTYPMGWGSEKICDPGSRRLPMWATKQ